MERYLELNLHEEGTPMHVSHKQWVRLDRSEIGASKGKWRDVDDILFCFTTIIGKGISLSPNLAAVWRSKAVKNVKFDNAYCHTDRAANFETLSAMDKSNYAGLWIARNPCESEQVML